jgi:trigger factor
MLKTVEDITKTKKRLTIEIAADAIEQEIKDSLEKLRRKTTIPGFRPGKAPLDLIEKRFGKDVESEVLDRIIPQGYMEALQEADITPVANPVLEDKIDFKRHQPVSLTLTVEIMPKIGTLRYENIPVKDIPVSVADADIESVLKRQQEEKATYEPSDGPIGMGDLIVFDYSVPGEGIEAKDQVFKIGGSMVPDDVSQKLIGKNRGDTFAVETTFPEDHSSEKLAGRQLNLNIVVKDIKKVHLPEIDDELAKDLGFGNLDELKSHISGEILKAKKNEVSKMQKVDIIKNLTEAHDFDLPESLVEEEAALLASSAQTGKRGGGEGEDQDLEAVKREMRPAAINNVRASLLIQAIGKEQGVAVSDDEVKGALLSLSQRLGVSPENIMKFYISRDGSLNGLRNSLFEEKVLDLVLAKATVEKGE